MAMLDDVKTLLKIDSNDDSKDSIISLYLTLVSQSIVNICGFTSTLPTVLEHIPTEIVVKMMKEDTNNVKSIKAGDTETQFANALKNIPEYIKSYEEELSNFNQVVIL